MSIFDNSSIRHMVGMLLIFACVGCESAAQRAQRIEPTLSQAGFVVVQADTPARIEKLNNIKPAKLSSFPVNGKQLYWFADPYVCHCVFRGTEQNYQMYQQLTTDQERAEALDDYATQQAYTEYMGGAANQVFYGQ
jgi:hypothetical protein